MSLLLVFFYLLVWSAGLINLFILTLLLVRDRDRLYLQEFLLMLAFTILLVMQSLPLMAGELLHTPAFQVFHGILVELGLALLVYALPAYVHRLDKVAWEGLADRIVLAGAAVSLVAGLTARFAFGQPDGSLISFVVCMTAITWALGLAVHGLVIMRSPAGAAKQQAENSETVRMAIRIGLFTLVLLPFLVWFDFLDKPLPLLGWERPAGFHVSPVIFLAWSLSLLGLRVRGLMTRADSRHGPMIETRPDFCAEYGISPREQEVMDLLIQGRSYEELADSLCISLSTAKTHIGRIYRKVGVNSKVELIHALQINRKADRPPAIIS